ncbi:MAG TPA: aldehyde dehydrogenase family protein [Stellaceae bacterium]|nr:aldehyde dehydrogenase family protein [Stellaceae bacterium]
MSNNMKFYIDGAWVDPIAGKPWDVINPATETVAGQVALGTAADIDRAVAAARHAFATYSETSKQERLGYLRRIVEICEARREELSHAMTLEMGSPISFSRDIQSGNAIVNFREMIATVEKYEFEQFMGEAMIRREAIGVCGLITPWNWPLNQITSKLASAFAAGCTVVWKPSEIAPLSAVLLAEIMHEAGLPKGVFNMVQGDGATVGEAISGHPDIDMVSFTGSTRAGILIAKAAANTVKRVTQELGGKSPNIILPTADITHAVTQGVQRCFANTGQSCQAPTRLLIHREQRDQALEVAKKAARTFKLGDPSDPATTMGPVVSKTQFDKVQRLIESGIAQGATLVCGGPGRPEGISKGYYIRPTVFADVTRDMDIAREEIFGPVLSIIVYDSEDEAVTIANDTLYGLSAYVSAGDLTDAQRVGKRIRAGRVYLNGAPADRSAPFGGYKQSGNGREKGRFGLEEYLEVKALLGYRTA